MSKELSLDGLQAVKALAEARAAAKAAEAAVKAATAQVRALLGDATEGTVAGVTVVKVTTVTRHGIDGKALAKALPEVYAEYETTTTYERVDL